MVTDLMLASRVRTALEGAGHQVEQGSKEAADPAAILVAADVEAVDLVVADLDAVPPERLGELGVPVIGFYQHTDVEMKARADRAGLALAVPRSRMVRELPELVAGLISGSDR